MGFWNNDLSNLILLDNLVEIWIATLVISAVLFLLIRFTKHFIEKRLLKLSQKTTNNIDDYIYEIFSSISPIFILVLSIFITSKIIFLGQYISETIDMVFLLIVFWQLTKWAIILANKLFSKYKNIKTDKQDMHGVTAINGVSAITKFAIWLIFLMLALDNLGVDITALVAGLGIGGLAIALAAQSILGDLFASLTIMIDKPIAIGDYIVVDNYMGTVKSIGIKSTKIESLTGEEIIISNSDLLNSRLRNFEKQRMQKRRTTIMLGLVYETSYEKLNQVQDILNKIVDEADNADYVRASFVEFADFSLNYELVYDVLSPDYPQYIEVNHKVRLKIFEIFKKEGLDFAYPTRTIHLSKD